MDELSERVKMIEDKISELEHRLIDFTQLKQWRENTKKKKKMSRASRMWGIITKDPTFKSSEPRYKRRECS